ncbi:hypothetical protein PsYK624_094210 [Phanerochaete sordida]|uniref:Uncharacterized protein n=1 Tax=Phanerochaete sordida TaxID=48140 RepID=A0A9P3GCK3_9APHY|nr:hypothetical protein PsYK624_094210 [Phanerochaete sordida]
MAFVRPVYAPSPTPLHNASRMQSSASWMTSGRSTCVSRRAQAALRAHNTSLPGTFSSTRNALLATVAQVESWVRRSARGRTVSVDPAQAGSGCPAETPEIRCPRPPLFGSRAEGHRLFSERLSTTPRLDERRCGTIFSTCGIGVISADRAGLLMAGAFNYSAHGGATDASRLLEHSRARPILRSPTFRRLIEHGQRDDDFQRSCFSTS